MAYFKNCAGKPKKKMIINCYFYILGPRKIKPKYHEVWTLWYLENNSLTDKNYRQKVYPYT